jgi:release factor glutamine methyltransferase
MTLQEGKQTIINAISSVYDGRESGNIASLLVEWITGKGRIDQLLDQQQLLTDNERKVLSNAAQRLGTGEPVQYIVGTAWFMGLPFKVTPDTLIPRPETEELVEWMIRDLQEQGNPPLSVLEIGTGSGCIPISLKIKAPGLLVQSIDISGGAVEVARENAQKLNAAIEITQMDFLNPTNRTLLKPVDLIVSNPPYIKENERASMHLNVLNYEPAGALFVPDNDALIFYQAIRTYSETGLKPMGSIYLEINEQLGNEVLELFNDSVFQAVLKKDMQGKDRMIRAVKWI